MRNSIFRGNGLMSAALLATVAGMGALAQAMPAPRKGSAHDYRPTPPRMDTAMRREIAEHNAAVERRKAEKRARKMGR